MPKVIASDYLANTESTDSFTVIRIICLFMIILL